MSLCVFNHTFDRRYASFTSLVKGFSYQGDFICRWKKLSSGPTARPESTSEDVRGQSDLINFTFSLQIVLRYHRYLFYFFMEHCGWYEILKPDLHWFLPHCRRLLECFNNRCIFINRNTRLSHRELRERFPLEAMSCQKKIWFTRKQRIKRKALGSFGSHHQNSKHWDASSLIIKQRWSNMAHINV